MLWNFTSFLSVRNQYGKRVACKACVSLGEKTSTYHEKKWICKGYTFSCTNFLHPRISIWPPRFLLERITRNSWSLTQFLLVVEKHSKNRCFKWAVFKRLVAFYTGWFIWYLCDSWLFNTNHSAEVQVGSNLFVSIKQYFDDHLHSLTNRAWKLMLGRRSGLLLALRQRRVMTRRIRCQKVGIGDPWMAEIPIRSQVLGFGQQEMWQNETHGIWGFFFNAKTLFKSWDTNATKSWWHLTWAK